MLYMYPSMSVHPPVLPSTFWFLSSYGDVHALRITLRITLKFKYSDQPGAHSNCRREQAQFRSYSAVCRTSPGQPSQGFAVLQNHLLSEPR